MNTASTKLLSSRVASDSTPFPIANLHKPFLLRNERTSTIHKEALQDLWVMLARGQKYYSQPLSSIFKGNEVFRVNYKDNQATVVPDKELQNKSARSYFDTFQKLEIGQVSSNGIDLEVE
ncbi:hypothetical protein O9929_25840 [Vibrio lentus]|nr:hypothetical protein [Vibrio lentus]